MGGGGSGLVGVRQLQAINSFVFTILYLPHLVDIHLKCDSKQEKGKKGYTHLSYYFGGSFLEQVVNCEVLHLPYDYM